MKRIFLALAVLSACLFTACAQNDWVTTWVTALQIADALNLSSETIRWYRKKLLQKFDVANTPELIFQAREMGLL